MRWRKTDDEYLLQLDFVAFDTETTGIWAAAHRIVEIGAVKFRLGEQRIQRFQTLVNPEREIPAEVIEIHGINNAMVQSAPTIKPVLEQFSDFCGTDSILVAHNTIFDISFVGCEADRVGVPLMENLIIDTVDLYHKYRPGLDSYSLQSLMRKFGLGADQNHRASDDASLVWKLFTMVAQDFPVFHSYGEFKRAFAFYSMSQWRGDERPLPDQYREISQAASEGRALEIVYATNGQPPQSRTIWPKRLHNLRTVFYVTAYCEKAQAERTFRLDRIQSFHLA
ncbi:MAG: exonuclease domain-containing protein [Candidatus Zixiibacteriota bacterium]